MDIEQAYRGHAKPQDNLILVVDDDEDMLDFVSRVLRKELFLVETASSAEQALEKAKSLAPSAIITDLTLPSMGGQELVEELQDGPLVSVPVVVMSALERDAQTRVRVERQPNVVGFFEKPLDADALLSLLASALHLGR